MDFSTFIAINPEIKVVFLAMALWSLSEIVGANILPRLRGATVQKSKSDRWSYFLVGFGMFFSIVISINFAANGITPLPEPFFYIGLAMMLAGIAIRQWAIWVLGKHFSTVVRIIKGHRLVKTGPYALVRHPSYTGALLIMLGLGLAFRTWGGALIILIIFGLAYGYRIRVEETALKSEFGKEYVEYSKKTARLIPGLI